MAVVHALKVVGTPSEDWVVALGIFQLGAVLIWGVYLAPFLSKKFRNWAWAITIGMPWTRYTTDILRSVLTLSIPDTPM